MKKIIAVASILLGWYFVGAFSSWNINPALWSDGCRSSLAFMSMLTLGLYALYLGIIADD